MSRPRLMGTVTPVRRDVSSADLVVLGPSLGTTTTLWDEVAHNLAADFRVVRFDLPGHGASPATTEPFSVAELAEAVVDLVDSIGGGSFAYAGISLGGAIGLELANRVPARVTSLAVICAGAQFGTAEGWRDRAARARASGTASLVALSAERWFAPGYLEAHPSEGGAALSQLVEVDDESYALCCEALAVFDAGSWATGIPTPTLCIAGEFDVAMPAEQVERLADLLPAARFVTLAGAAHLPAMERPAELSALIRTRLGGMRIRREVLGDAHVDRAIAATTVETADFQSFITRYAWGEIWGRPALTRRERSLLTLAALITGGHSHELAMHVRAALTNGLTPAEISEAMLHTAIYAGLPAANAALGIATQIFSEQGPAEQDAAEQDFSEQGPAEQDN